MIKLPIGVHFSLAAYILYQTRKKGLYTSYNVINIKKPRQFPLQPATHLLFHAKSAIIKP